MYGGGADKRDCSFLIDELIECVVCDGVVWDTETQKRRVEDVRLAWWVADSFGTSDMKEKKVKMNNVVVYRDVYVYIYMCMW